MNRLFRRLVSLTLIEMLVVIAIIGILAAMLMPALQRAREEGRKKSCVNNLKRIGTAMYMYSGSNNEFHPYDTSSHATDSMGLLYPSYIEIIRIFRCISTTDRPEVTVYKHPDGTLGRRSFGSTSPTWSSYGYDHKTGLRNVSAMTPIVADMDGSSVTKPRSATANHQGGQNVLFYDTHVDWKAVNTWGNPQLDNDASDNFFTNDHGGGDTDSYISRP